MNLFRIDFQEVYERHLCRHGHFGINVLHLIVVLVIYIAIFGLVGAVVDRIAPDNRVLILLGLTLPWFILVLMNCPLRVSCATAVIVLMLLGLYAVLPRVPVWVWPVLIFAMHHFQQYSHRIYPMRRNMDRYAEKYRKGPLLFVLLLVYELPILLNYLLFGRPDWVAGCSEIVDA
ncbi:MAG TPA: hypothetical protein DCG12_12865 [Planctomycetaceae bacterium]|nr:hypothetical protein [Planctomycetaceae bacterium]